MRRIFVSVFLGAACATTALAGGCSQNKGAGGADAAVDGYRVPVSDGASVEDEGPGDDAGDTATSEETTMRLAHASPDLGPIDFCWRQTGTATFIGPVLQGQLPVDAGSHADASPDGPHDAGHAEAAPPGDGASDGAEVSTPAPPDAEAGTAGELVFGTMSGDVLLPSAGTFDIAVVPAGQASCVAFRFAGTVTLDAGKRATVVLMGVAAEDAGPDALSVVAFTDAPTDPQTARVRMIHAALGAMSEPATGPLSVRGGVTLLTSEVDPRMTSAPSTAPPVDALGYATLTPLQPPTPFQLAELGDGPTTKWTTAETDLGVLAGTSHTGVIVTVGQGALGVAWCTDLPSDRGPACSLLVAQP
jgi:hypothetical protein